MLRAGAARYCARNPVALGRMEYHQEDSAVTYRCALPRAVRLLMR